MKKELVLLQQGKPVAQRDMLKIVETIEEGKTNLLYTLYEILQLCGKTTKKEQNFSILYENVFADMKIENVKQVPQTQEIEKLPSFIMNVLGYDILLFKEEKGFNATCPSLHGCITQGDTEKEAIKNAKDAIKGYLECAEKHGLR